MKNQMANIFTEMKDLENSNTYLFFGAVPLGD
jgi:hypothetical protein